MRLALALLVFASASLAPVAPSPEEPAPIETSTNRCIYVGGVPVLCF